MKNREDGQRPPDWKEREPIDKADYICHACSVTYMKQFTFRILY